MHGGCRCPGAGRAALAAIVALAALAAAPSALAHAQLVATEPADDAVLAESPAQVVLRFNEAVETAFGAVRVYDAAAKRVDDGDVGRPDSRTVTVGVDGRLARGTYTVTWRVLSADSHPVAGAFVFHVGAPGANPAGVAAEVGDGGAPRSVSVAFTTLRFLDFALILLLAGGAAVLAFVLNDAAPGVRRGLAGGLAAAAGALVAVSAAGVVVQGAAAGGFGLGEALDPDVVRAVLETRFGNVWALQALAAVVLAAAFVALRARPAQQLVGAVTVGVAAALTVTPAAAGHASVSGAAAFTADVAHVAAAAAWTGGLALLVGGLVLSRSERWPLAARAVPRFSSLAVVSVAVLVVAGTVNGYLQVRALRGLWETTYGLLLLGKLALLVPLFALAAYNNRYAVPRLRAQIASAGEQRRFLNVAGAELALMVAVVAVTAVLVAEPPARAEVAPDEPFATIVQLGTLELNLVVDPAVAGANEVHLYLTDSSGRPAEVDATAVLASLPSKRIGPLRLRALRAGPGHFVVRGAQLALAGTWTLRVEARRGEFESLVQSVSVPIREE
jgi:copper transport protein